METPQDLADAARRFLREKFLRVKTAVSGANFLIAETGGVCIVESEGQWADVPDAAGDADYGGGDRQGGAAVPGSGSAAAVAAAQRDRRADESVQLDLDGCDTSPAAMARGAFHVVLMDNARTEILADEEARQTLQLHPLRRLPECLPGVSADGRACVWQRVCRADWRDSDAAVDGDASRAESAVCVESVRRVL